MNVATLEDVAAGLRRRARLRDHEVALAPTIAARILGHDGLRFGAPDVTPHYDPTSHRIVVPERYPDLNFAIAHELAEMAFRSEGVAFADYPTKERAANYVAAALLAPPVRVRFEAMRALGDLRVLASIFHVDQSTIALRLAEVLGEKRAVVTRTNNVLSRGVPTEIDLVAFARDRRCRLPGLTKTVLTGRDRGRVAILAS